MILPGNFLIHKISNLVDYFNQNFHPNARGQTLSKTAFICKIMFTFLKINYLILNLNPL